MKIFRWSAIAAAMSLLQFPTSCGGNGATQTCPNIQCGPGTGDVNGVCEPGQAVRN